MTSGNRLRKSFMGGTILSRDGWSVSFRSSGARIDSILYTEGDRAFTLACETRAGKLTLHPETLHNPEADPGQTGAVPGEQLILDRIVAAATYAGWTVKPPARKQP